MVADRDRVVVVVAAEDISGSAVGVYAVFIDQFDREHPRGEKACLGLRRSPL